MHIKSSTSSTPLESNTVSDGDTNNLNSSITSTSESCLVVNNESASNSNQLLDKLHQEHLIKCSFNNWYKKFEKISIQSKYIRIPDNVLEYLRDEIIVLPKECMADRHDSRFTFRNYSQSSSRFDNESSDSDNDDDDDESNTLQEPEFIEFSNEIKRIINSLSGSVFIKTNWHCPKDAFWITLGQTLKVKDITDVYQLLKASSIIKNDISNEYCESNQNDYYLVLKEWKEINTGTEFRCFVKNRSLIAISPRDWPQYHEHILTQKHDIIQDIVSMFKELIKHKFELDDFVFDVIRATKDKVYLVDFSPFNSKYTESLAFSWQELQEYEVTPEDVPEFRYLPSDCGIQPNRRNNYGVPQDIIDLFSGNRSAEADNAFSHLTDVLTSRFVEEINIHNSGT